MRKSVYYTKATLLSNANADLALRSKSIQRLARKPISNIMEQLSKRKITVLDEAYLKLANKKFIYVINSGGQMTASDAARLLATQSAQSGRNVVVCDTTGQVEKEIKERTAKGETGTSIHKINDNLSSVTGVIGSSFFTSKTFNTTVRDLAGRFDQIFICASNRNTQLGLMGLQEFAPSLVIISGLRKTKKSDITNIKARMPIDLLFHD